MNTADTRHLLLGRAIGFARAGDSIQAVFAASKSEQVGDALDPIHELRLDVSALGDQSLPRGAAGDLAKEGEDQTQSEEKANKHKSDRRVEGGEKDRYAHRNQDGGQ